MCGQNGAGVVGNEVPIRLLLADDHLVVADALRDVLSQQDDLEVVEVLHSITDLRSTVDGLGRERECPDLAILDVRFPDGDGVAEVAHLRRRCPQLPVLILTASTAVDVLAAAVRAGAAGFVTKTAPVEHLLDAVRRVARGETAFDAEDLVRLSNHLAGADATDLDPLTDREREVLAALARARTTAEIAEDLVLSQHTVRNHVRSILSKLGAQSKLEAVLTAVRRGLITLD